MTRESELHIRYAPSLLREPSSFAEQLLRQFIVCAHDRHHDLDTHPTFYAQYSTLNGSTVCSMIEIAQKIAYRVILQSIMGTSQKGPSPLDVRGRQ